MFKIKSFLLALLLLSVGLIEAKTYKAENKNQFDQLVKNLVAGDSLVLANGVWNDAELVFKANGSAESYITLTAETPGKVILSGKSCLRISGNRLFISELVFKNGYSPRSNVIEFRTGSKDYTYNSVLSACVIDKFNKPVKDSADHWIGLYGKKIRVENCYFGGKSNLGTTLVIWPNDSNSIENEHLIYRNYFGARPRLGSNGGETIRIGTSQVCHLNSSSIIDGNYFEHCNGEVEIISNKSGNNRIVNNSFFECEGSVVLRHGNNAMVSGNWFIGNDKPFTGGVRVINEGHKIYNNYFYRLAGDEFRSGLAVMNAIPNSAANGYAPVRNVLIANNTYYECAFTWGFGVGFGERDRTVKPESTLLLNNLIYNTKNANLVKFYDSCDGVKFDNNILISSSGNLKEYGGVDASVTSGKSNQLDMVYSSAKAKKLPFVKYDILGQLRNESVIGAFQNTGDSPAIEMASAKNCGPEWYKASVISEIEKPKPVGKTLNVAPGAEKLTQAIKKAGAGDILLLEAGEHIISNKIVLSKDITLQSADPTKKAILKMQSSRENNSFFEIAGNPRISLKNLIINGDSKASFPAKYAIVTSKEDATAYKLIISGCEVFDFNVDAGAIFKAYKSSLADSIIVRDSYFHDSYRGFSLADEKEDIGKYNAENIVFENSVFKNFSQYLVDFYRGGNDESTLGGAFFVDHCVFDAVANDAKQTIFKTNGVVVVNITNSIFSNSLAKQSVKLSGAKNRMNYCNFSGCIDARIEKGGATQNILFVSPKYKKGSFETHEKSKLKGKGSDNSNIGLR